MSDQITESAEGIGDATDIAHQYIEKHSDNSWERVTDAHDNIDTWEIEFKLDDRADPRSISIEKESGNICEINLK